MAEEKTPKPTLEEPAEGTTGKETSEAEMAKELLKELDSLGIGNKEELQNMQRASSESGRLAQMLGQERQERERLAKEIETLKRQSGSDDFDEYFNEGRNPDERPATIRDIKNIITDMQTANVRATQQAWDEYEAIQQDPDYNLFAESFNKQINDPKTQAQLNRGQISLTRVYQDTVRGGYRELLKTFRGKVEDLAGTTKTKPPHMESSDHSDPSVQTFEKSDKQERLEQIQKNRTGSDDDIDNMLDAILPKGDISKMRFST